MADLLSFWDFFNVTFCGSTIRDSLMITLLRSNGCSFICCSCVLLGCYTTKETTT